MYPFSLKLGSPIYLLVGLQPSADLLRIRTFDPALQLCTLDVVPGFSHGSWRDDQGVPFTELTLKKPWSPQLASGQKLKV